MIVECLHIACPPDKRAAFLERDADVWTRGLMGQPGFLGKEVWFNPEKPGEVVLVIHFESLAKLRSISPEWCAATDAAMGDLLLPLTAEIFEVTAPDPRYRQSIP